LTKILKVFIVALRRSSKLAVKVLSAVLGDDADLTAGGLATWAL